MADTHAGASSHYFIPAPSRWPMVGSIAMVFTMFGAAMVVNLNPAGWIGLAIGLATLIYMMIGWFDTVSAESERGNYNRNVDVSFRLGMSWFIFSEVMFFASFFGALFYARVLAVPDLGSLVSRELLWPDFSA